MEAPRQFSARHFAAGKSCRSKLGAIEHDMREPIMTPSYIARRCVMVGSIKSRFAHGNTPFHVSKPLEGEKFRAAPFPPGTNLPKPDHLG
jgi:hypothetical protein